MELEKNTQVNRLSVAMKVAAASAVLAFTGVALTACNTTEGVGKDVKAAGGALEDAASDAKD